MFGLQLNTLFWLLLGPLALLLVLLVAIWDGYTTAKRRGR